MENLLSAKRNDVFCKYIKGDISMELRKSKIKRAAKLSEYSLLRKIRSTSLLRGPPLYAENFSKSGTPDPRVVLRSDCNFSLRTSFWMIYKKGMMSRKQ